MSRLAPPHDLVDVAREIQKADGLITEVTTQKLALIAEQIRNLQDQARTLLYRAKRDADLHRAQCNFQKRPGQIYHLYRRPKEQLYWSMLSPSDWDNKPPHNYEGSFRYELDMSWTSMEEIHKRDAFAASIPLLTSPEPSPK